LQIDNFNRAYAEIEIRKHDNAGYEPIKFKYDPGADIFGQLIPKGLAFPFTCLCKRNVPMPKNVDCNGCELTGRQVGGFRSLLGNDILSCFDAQINRSTKQITLTKISDLTERNAMYNHCQVNELEKE